MKTISLRGKAGLGKLVIVDDDDYKIIGKLSWYLDRYGYACRIDPRQRKNVSMARFINKTPKGMICDHKNHNTLDNRKENLRNCSPLESTVNCRKRNVKNKTSEYKGVSWFKKSKKWRLRLKIGGKDINIGYFNNEHHAALFYDLWAKDLFGEYACTNFKSVLP